MERTVDLIAQDLNLDPAEVRQKNPLAPDAFPYTTPTGVTYDSGDYARGLERVLELADYAHWRERARQRRAADAALIGVGLATVVKASGAYGDYRVDSAQVHIAPTGHITASTGVSPHGQGSETTFAQIVADELGVNPAEVQVRHGIQPYCPQEAAPGPVGADCWWLRALYGAPEARHKLAHLAAYQLQCPAEAVAFQEGRVFDRRYPEQTLPFAEVAAAAYDSGVLAARPRGWIGVP